MSCPNCNRSFRNGGNGLAFHLTWCKPAQPMSAQRAEDITYMRIPATAADVAIAEAITADRQPAPVVARAPRGRLLTRKARATRWRAEIRSALLRNLTRLDVHEAGLLVSCRHTGCAVDSDAAAEYHLIAPVVAPEHKAPAVRKAAGPKMPTVGSGKHSRCVAHVPMTRTAPGVAYACFDVAPDADAIAERQTFVAVLDASWMARHEVYVSRLAPDVTDAARALVGHERHGILPSRLFTPEERAEAFQLEIDLIAERAKPDTSAEHRAQLRRMTDRMSFLRTGVETREWNVQPDSITPVPSAYDTAYVAA